MFDRTVYVNRRNHLARAIGQGVILHLGHEEAPMNAAENCYPFRQDSSFLYYWGHAKPHLAGLIDVDEGRHILFADSPTVSDIVWMGPRPNAAALGERVGASEVRPAGELFTVVRDLVASGRRVHYEPPYRKSVQLKLAHLVGNAEPVAGNFSKPLVRAVIAQRSIKEAREVSEIESALDVTYDMHTTAMRMAQPGRREQEIAAHVEMIAIAGGGRLAFPCIFSRRGETLHNHTYKNTLQAGDLVVHDSGAASAMHYASDITRTIPVGGTFSPRQRAIYKCVLSAQQAAIAEMKPGVPFKQAHLVASQSMATDLKALGLMRGDVDEAVGAGAHALFFPHGLGHMMGLDVHDMEALGEDYVGYTPRNTRSRQFGLKSLRLAKPLEPGHVVTVEPGCYFIGALIDQWEAKKQHEAFINYEALRSWRDFGGVRIEDDVLVTEEGVRILGKAIPKSPEEVEATVASQA